MKYYATGLRAAVLTSVYIMLLASGCGVNKNQTDMTESLNALQDVNTEESGNPDVEEMEELSTIYDMDSEMIPPEEASQSTPVGQDGGLITDTATLQAVLDIVKSSSDQTVLDYVEFTSEEFLAEDRKSVV